MKKMKKTQKFTKRSTTEVMTLPPKIEPAKQSPNVAKTKHMMFVNHNMERAFDETTREGFDFRNTKNQFIHTSKGSIFQQTSRNNEGNNNSARKMSMTMMRHDDADQ